MKWKDASSYSQNDKRGPEPKTIEANAGWLKIYVTKHKDFPEQWVLRVYDLGIDTRPLRAYTLDQAKLEAVAIVKEKLQEALEKLGGTP